MKALIQVSILCLVLLATLQGAAAREVTLTTDTVGDIDGNKKPSDEVSIGTNEVAQINTILPWGSLYSGLAVEVIKDGITFRVTSGQVQSGSAGVGARVAGPATIRLTNQVGTMNPLKAFCTVQIIPESFPPDKTIIIPADTKGANIIMECSPDLIRWTNSVPGLYTNTTGHLFFRLRAERIP